MKTWFRIAVLLFTCIAYTGCQSRGNISPGDQGAITQATRSPEISDTKKSKIPAWLGDAADAFWETTCEVAAVSAAIIVLAAGASFYILAASNAHFTVK